jgi:uncharacterized protein (DUF1697 family)
VYLWARDPVATTFVALLRGINVGGKRALPMKELVAIFAAAGCGNVRSYIQSGNVVFEAGARAATRAMAAARARILEDFGIDVPLIVRSADEMRRVIDENPFLRDGAPEKTLHVAFLADQPNAERVRALDPNRSLPDSFVVVGRDIYLRLPNGAGRSKLTNAYFDSKLDTISTGRNWRTVVTLDEMMRG